MNIMKLKVNMEILLKWKIPCLIWTFFSFFKLFFLFKISTRDLKVFYIFFSARCFVVILVSNKSQRSETDDGINQHF